MPKTSKNIPFHLLDRLSALEQIAAKSENDSLKFYHGSARNILFDLEAICRILRFEMGKEIIGPYYRRFKYPEDQLGAYDYHEALYNGISDKQKTPAPLVKYFKSELDKAGNMMQKFLSKEGWLNTKDGIYKTLKENFSDLDFPSADDLRKSLGKFIIRELEKAETAYENGDLNPYNIEDGLHELRRKLRWISMYAQVVDGWIQLRKTESSKELALYQTKEIVESKFNKLPFLKEKSKPMIIDSGNFYALSWIINELGKLKDAGMKVLAINSALNSLEINDKNQIKNIRELYDAPLSVLDESPAKATILLDDFFFKNRVAKNIIRDIKRSL